MGSLSVPQTRTCTHISLDHSNVCVCVCVCVKLHYESGKPLPLIPGGGIIPKPLPIMLFPDSLNFLLLFPIIPSNNTIKSNTCMMFYKFFDRSGLASYPGRVFPPSPNGLGMRIDLDLTYYSRILPTTYYSQNYPGIIRPGLGGGEV